ncbi:MAG: ABC transporter substrate-binding protein [Spirochaetia bacterium]
MKKKGTLKKVSLILLLICLAVSVLVVGCKKEEEAAAVEETEKQEKAEAVRETLVYATTDKVSDMDPANAYDFHTWELFRNVSRGLLAYRPGTTELIPGLAEDYTVNDAGDVYTFELREGVNFSDGTPFDAEAVKWSIDRVMNIAGDPSWLVTDFVDSVDVVDEYTVRFNLKGSVGFFPDLVATVPYFPMNPNIFPADRWVNEPSELEGGELSGLGPYKIVSFKRDEEVILEKNAEYYGEEPAVDMIAIRYYADATTMRLALENGEVDLVYKDLNPSDKADLLEMTEYKNFEIPSSYIRYLCFETSESVFQDARTRQAVAALIDRPDVIDKVFLGQMEPLYSMIPRGMKWHSDDFEDALGDGNVELATELLSGMGYSEADPFSFELWYTPTHYGDTEVDVAEVLRVQFEKCPLIDVTIKSAEWSTYIDNWDSKTMPSFLLGWYPDYMDPDNYTAAFAGTSGSKGMGIYFSDPEWDALFQKEQQTPDQDAREDVFMQIQEMWTEEVPTAPIFQGKLYIFTQPDVGGVKVGTDMVLHYDTLYFE